MTQMFNFCGKKVGQKEKKTNAFYSYIRAAANLQSENYGEIF